MFTLAQQYRYSGTQRDDFAASNAAARAAREKYGEMPTDVLEGTRRSRFAPPILRRSPLSTAGSIERKSTAAIVPPTGDAIRQDETSAAATDEDANHE
jgi:hypothetical protein